MTAGLRNPTVAYPIGRVTCRQNPTRWRICGSLARSRMENFLREPAFQSRTGRSSKPISVPSLPPRATIAISEWRVIGGIRLRRRASDQGMTPVVDGARFCDGWPTVRASGCTRQVSAHWRRDYRSGTGAWRCRRHGRVARLRHGIGTGWIENGRRQRRRGRHILRACVFDRDAGSKDDCASAYQKLR
jgi:hypothetical protein